MNGSQAYLSAVEHGLDCPRRQKRLLLQKFSDSTLSELNGSYDELCAQLGQPEEVAEALMECVDPEVLDKSKRKKKIIIGVSVGAVMAAFAVAIGFLGHYYFRARPYVEVDGPFTVITTEPVKISEEEISDEEFEQLMNDVHIDPNLGKKLSAPTPEECTTYTNAQIGFSVAIRSSLYDFLTIQTQETATRSEAAFIYTADESIEQGVSCTLFSIVSAAPDEPFPEDFIELASTADRKFYLCTLSVDDTDSRDSALYHAFDTYRGDFESIRESFQLLEA